MSSEDDNFIREVNEELRSDAATAIWKKYGKFIIGGAVAIVVGVAGNVAYKEYTANQAAASGDIFLEALTAAREGRQDEAIEGFDKLEAEGYGAYPLMAKLRAATVLADKGDASSAIAAFQAVSGDNGVPKALQDIAKIRAAYLLVDHGSYDDVSREVEVLTDTENAMRHSAREALGLAAYKANDFARAKEWMQLIVDDRRSPQQMSSRAQVILDLIAGRSAAS
ncbi:MULTISPECIES: tetratricopeptide repeat protein [unclassified Lentilitoribacter]|jgi:hypothetical protein|uniref:tetratricopeptide repeat protein n=1 Tax=unclassified Lentilitoribacter TaxID=2647570 RepID=UPI0013A6ED6F|nr:tetratricopeptide repeat protein [Lentilitoribacter sp. Alg239-R112]